MASCDLVTAPTGSAPLSNTDYDAQNNYIQAAINKLLSDQLHLTEWDTLTEPEMAQYVYVQHGGALFRVNDGNLEITGAGALANGRVYIKVTRAGDELDFSFTNSAAGYSWNYVYNGFYHADDTQLLPYILYRTTYFYPVEFYKYNLDGLFNPYDITSNLVKILQKDSEGRDLDLYQVVDVDLDLIDCPFPIYNHVFHANLLVTNDAKNKYYPIMRFNDLADPDLIGGGSYEVGAGRVGFARRTGGVFDDADYDDDSFPRGKALIFINI